MKTYYLKNKDGEIWAKFEITDLHEGSSLDGQLYEATAWSGCDQKTPIEWSFIADIYGKWDSCTHWWFRGEDCDPELKTEKDSYYHLCGGYCFAGHIRNMCFAWKVMCMVLSGNRDDSYALEYYTEGSIGEVIEFMLKDFTIEEEKCNS
ncbi:MAG: hypothetical protein IKA94_00560 [Mogibacterium sp.]|nr:hypothetical protein [Mogibacterium sp.]